MPPTRDRAACPNRQCATPHVIKTGRLKGRQRYHCRGCGTWFTETTGTPLYRLHTPVAEIALALRIVMQRGSLRGAEQVTGHKYETIGHWLHLANEHADALTASLVHDLHLSRVEIDEFWSYVKKRTAAASRLTRRLPAGTTVTTVTTATTATPRRVGSSGTATSAATGGDV